MPITAFMHSHVLVVVLFLILFIIKAFMLFTNKTQALEKLKRKTKVLDIILGVLILITGGYLMFQYNGIPTWLLVKVALVLVAIPVAITGLKKLNKPLVALALAIFVYVYGVAESKNLSMKKAAPTVTKTKAPATNTAEENGMDSEAETAPAIHEAMSGTALANAEQIYAQLCESCHGADGKKGLNNASDLATSALGLEERKNIILNGRGLMPAYKGQVTEQEAEEIAAFTLMLNQY
ncbi:cytochrome c [Adhaeribacter sp. BT258]|uniref:Cytochrome c n=1 Tax=Adhaeribacter terrigena TaxID=2793070 RepID=A0ABS1C239_9BACT|nr:cytochrome c [Adhaeribacter terrigena]MBK0403395.1 cytochrome c [Adhaeribacter terrigena]